MLAHCAGHATCRPRFHPGLRRPRLCRMAPGLRLVRRLGAVAARPGAGAARAAGAPGLGPPAVAGLCPPAACHGGLPGIDGAGCRPCGRHLRGGAVARRHRPPAACAGVAAGAARAGQRQLQHRALPGAGCGRCRRPAAAAPGPGARATGPGMALRAARDPGPLCPERADGAHPAHPAGRAGRPGATGVRGATAVAGALPHARHRRPPGRRRLPGPGTRRYSALPGALLRP